MLNSSKSFFIGFLLSSSLYVVVLFFLTHTYLFSSESLIRFTARKNDFLDVTIVESKKSSQSVDKNIPKGSTTNKQEATSDLKNLFASIDTTKIPKEEPKKVENVVPPSRLKGSSQDQDKTNLSSIVDNLSIQHTQNYKDSSTAQYDAHKGKIVDILDENWQKYISVVLEAEADVKISINPNGKFSYNIVRLSKNDMFNEELYIYLEDMKKITFPSSPDGKEFSFDTKFNTKRGISL